MLISIIIPYYKDEINILHSVNSAIKQSYKNIEIIIIDDENSVISKKILLSIKKKSKKIKVILLKKNVGVSQARNLGISRASGRLIAFLDSDDIWKRDKLTMQVDFMNKNKIDLCYTNYYAFSGKKIIYKVKIKKSFDYNQLLNECPISCSSVLLKKNILNENKFRNLKTKEDYELWLRIAKKNFNSRLIVGTGKYKSMSECAKAIRLSGAEIVTVAVRRVNISDKKKPLLMDYIDPKKITYLPNTAGCFNSEEALRTLRLAREIGGWKLVKLEVLGDKKNLFPDMIETLKSTEVLTKEGFKVMVYCNDDPLMAKRLENVGACAIMPLAAPIGSGLGIQNATNIKIIRSQTKLPVIIDAGLGQASDATIAMELGCDGVLANTAIAKAKKPFHMALAFKNGVIAGRQSFLAGRIEKSLYGSASSPKAGII